MRSEATSKATSQAPRERHSRCQLCELTDSAARQALYQSIQGSHAAASKSLKNSRKLLISLMFNCIATGGTDLAIA
jgi:hypothetical protein